MYNTQKGNLDSFFPNDYPFYALCPLVKAEFIALEQIEKKKKGKKIAVSGGRTWPKDYRARMISTSPLKLLLMCRVIFDICRLFCTLDRPCKMCTMLKRATWILLSQMSILFTLRVL